MAVWALADLHLSFGVADKEMSVFGDNWKDWTDKIHSHWTSLIKEEDLVLLPGDISWAMRTDQVIPDLEWIHRLPGTKVMLRGNHDYWWSSLSKVEKILPSSIHLVQNNSFTWKNVAIGGTRLWDSAEYNFNPYIIFADNPRAKKLTATDEDRDEAERIFIRELSRLEMSLKSLDKNATVRIAMTHYPPIGADLQPSRTSALLEKYGIQHCVFGHLHNVKQNIPMFGTKNGIKYYLTSCDYLDFTPIKILD